MEPKITIGIACYNQDKFVEEAVESALAQTVKCEIIAVNDGSTDRTGSLLAKYPIKVINQNNKGLPSARNTMIMNMTGDYLLPLDSDDILMEHCVEKIIQTIKATNADIVSPSFKMFGAQEGEAILMPNPTVQDFKYNNRVGYCSAIKRTALQEIGGYSPRMWWGYEDYALWIDLLKRGKKMVTIPEPLWLYRTKNNSMFSNALKHHDQLISQIILDNREVYPEFFNQPVQPIEPSLENFDKELKEEKIKEIKP